MPANYAFMQGEYSAVTLSGDAVEDQFVVPDRAREEDILSALNWRKEMSAVTM